ncbi:MAG TPA: polysaccharide deacetylase family protein, partial [Verrucomicrobiae bacterium]|nr:polysaccharide deacetylase family protein [Verrucomicrobiae bacterium]
TDAFPVLQQHGFSATMFLPTAFIREKRRMFKERECMTWNEARELHRAGIEFGSTPSIIPRFMNWISATFAPSSRFPNG